MSDKLCTLWSDAMFCASGPSCSKLMTSLVNDLIEFTSSYTQICWNFCWKNVSSFCSAKATHIFFQQNILESAKTVNSYNESAKTVNEMTLNELVKLTMLWTTGPWYVSTFFAWACLSQYFGSLWYILRLKFIYLMWQKSFDGTWGVKKTVSQQNIRLK